MLPECPNPLPADLDGELRRLASLWAKHPVRPRIEPREAAHWDDLIGAWAADESLPLFIRKSRGLEVRGEVIIHDSGRELVPTDNSAALWSYLSAFCGQMPSISDIRSALKEDLIPVAMMVTREMKERSLYKCRVAELSPNTLGWKVCHRRRVGLGSRSPLKHRRLPDLQLHFRNFLSPSNMFLVPKLIGGLGEVPQFIEALSSEPRGL
jgi:hypothetical protein